MSDDDDIVEIVNGWSITPWEPISGDPLTAIGIDLASGPDVAGVAITRWNEEAQAWEHHWFATGTIAHITPPSSGLSAMKCEATNGYAGWELRDQVTGDRVEYVLWVDPDANEYCAIDLPLRTVNGEIGKTIHKTAGITVDLAALTFWFQPAPMLVAPLSQGRQEDQERSDQPCVDCCQPEACKRTGWCAAHRCGFGEKAP